MIRREGLILWAALIISVMVHLFILLPSLVQASSPSTDIIEEETLINESRFRPPEEEEDQTKLGIDESEASTLTWIGYREYQEHLARLAEVEQAELQAGSALPPAGGAPAAPLVPQVTPQPPAPPMTTEQTPTPPATRVPPAEDQIAASNARPADTSPPPPSGPPTTASSESPPPPGGRPVREQGQAAPGETPARPIGTPTPRPDTERPETEQPKDSPPVADPQESKAPASETTTPVASAPPESDPPKNPSPKPATSPPTPPTPPSTPGPGGTQGDAPPGENAPPARDETAEDLPPTPNASQSDSSASSTIKVPRKDWLSGRPIAAHGLQLRPRRPKFTALQKITSAGGKTMLVRMDFAANGKPAFASIIRGSGSPVLDKNVLASLYQWRASGQRLRELDKGQRIPVQLEIILSVN